MKKSVIAIILGLFVFFGTYAFADGNNQIILKIDQTKASVFGESVQNDVAPIIRADRTMLPARFVATNLGAEVEWYPSSSQVHITKGDINIILTLNSDIALVNGVEEKLDSPAFVENNRTYTPVRYIAEKLGATVDWESATKTIIITANEPTKEYETIFFGNYEQDNNTSNGKEPVEWLVLEKKNGYAYLISKYALVASAFNSTSNTVAWSDSSLRTYMNSSFLDAVFNSKEKEALADIDEKVSILNKNEIVSYFTTNVDRQCKATPYAKKRGAYVDKDGYCWWWLGSVGEKPFLSCYVTTDGEIDTVGKNILLSEGAVRPVIILNLTKLEEIQ